MACPRQTVGAHLKATGPDDAARANHRRWPCFGRACAATSFWGFASGGNTPSVAPLWTSTAERLALLSSWTARHTAVGWTWMHNAINSCWTTASACCDWKTTTSCSTSTARWVALRRCCRPVDVIARPEDTPLRLRTACGEGPGVRSSAAKRTALAGLGSARPEDTPLRLRTACGEGPGVRFSGQGAGALAWPFSRRPSAMRRMMRPNVRSVPSSGSGRVTPSPPRLKCKSSGALRPSPTSCRSPRRDATGPNPYSFGRPCRTPLARTRPTSCGCANLRL